MSGQLLRRGGPDFARFSPRVLAQYYRGEFAAATAVNLAYRGSVIIWLVTGLIQPIVLIIVWRTVAGLAAVLPASVIMVIAFGGDLSGITPGRVIASVPALIGAMVLRFIVEWVLALSAFWLTKVSALNNLYFSVRTFLSGGFAPLAVLPPVVATIATWSPFPWSQAFVVNVLMGETTGRDVLVGYAAQAGWIVIMLIVLRFVWSRAVRRYAAVGS